MDMFRYLLKYVGKYKVDCYKDLKTKDIPKDINGNIDEDFDDLFIPCKKGVIKHTYKSGILFWYCNKVATVTSVEKAIKKKYPKVWIEVEYFDGEGRIYFKDEDLVDKLSTIFKPEKSKERIGPFGEIVYNEYVKRRGRPRKTNA